MGETEEIAGAGSDAKSDQERTRGLSIYGYPHCPFCRRVFAVASSLGLDIPLRNTLVGGEHESDLRSALGRTTVPVLCIEREGAEPIWLPESADIVRYLEERFGSSA